MVDLLCEGCSPGAGPSLVYISLMVSFDGVFQSWEGAELWMTSFFRAIHMRSGQVDSQPVDSGILCFASLLSQTTAL